MCPHHWPLELADLTNPSPNKFESHENNTPVEMPTQQLQTQTNNFMITPNHQHNPSGPGLGPGSPLGDALAQCYRFVCCIPILSILDLYLLGIFMCCPNLSLGISRSWNSHNLQIRWLSYLLLIIKLVLSGGSIMYNCWVPQKCTSCTYANHGTKLNVT